MAALTTRSVTLDFLTGNLHFEHMLQTFDAAGQL